MNTLKIKLNPYKDRTAISLDGRPLSPYSELNDFTKEPFLSWADKLLDAAEREVNGEFALIVSGSRFETMFLEDMQKESETCVSYGTEPYLIDTKAEERLETVFGLLRKYGVPFDAEGDRLPLHTQVQLSVEERFVRPVAPEESVLCVVQDRSAVPQTQGNGGFSLVLLLSRRSCVSPLGASRYLWEVTEDRLHDAVGSVIDRFVKIPMLRRASGLLRKVAMAEADLELLELSMEVDAFLSVGEIGDLEAGDSVAVSVRALPESMEPPALRLVSSRPEVASAEGIRIRAVAPGKAYIDIYKSDENVPFARRQVTVYQEHSVRKIELETDAKAMGVGQSRQIGITLLPADADDIHLIQWSVSDSRVMEVSGDGTVVAKAPGKAVVTAAAKKASASVAIEVLPQVSGLSLSVAQAVLYVGQTRPVSVSVAPARCFDSSYEWKSSDRQVAIVDKLDDGTSVIRAIGIGDCVLTCTALAGGCSVSCSVKVESTFKKRENLHGMLSATLVCLVAALFCAVFFPAPVTLVAVAATVFCGMVAIGRNKADKAWAILLMAAAVLIALGRMGIISFF